MTNVAAQANQLCHAVEYKKENEKDDEVSDILIKAGATDAACVLVGPMVQSSIISANRGAVSIVVAADTGPL